jgi:outer membrane protein
MKKLFILLLFVPFIVGSLNAQRFAYVDTDYILSNIPAYESAQEQLDQISVEWQKEIEAVFAEIDKMYKEFQVEKALLTDEMRVKREEEIISKEREAKELQKKRFGRDGDLFKKRQELVKPLQDDVFNTVKDIATEGNYAMIFDVAGGGLVVLFSDPKYDKSDEFLQKLGFKN